MNWKNLHFSGEVIPVDFQSGERTDRPSTKPKEKPNSLFGKIISPSSACKSCGYNRFMAIDADHAHCIRCNEFFKFKEGMISKLPSVGSTPYEFPDEEDVPEEGHCEDCGKEVAAGETCDHHGFNKCTSCDGIRSYFIQSTGSGFVPYLRQHHLRFHKNPSNGEYYDGTIYGQITE